MKYEVFIDGISRSVEMERDASGSLRVRLDRRIFDADAVEILPGTFSILIAGCAFEARSGATAKTVYRFAVRDTTFSERGKGAIPARGVGPAQQRLGSGGPSAGGHANAR